MNFKKNHDKEVLSHQDKVCFLGQPPLLDVNPLAKVVDNNNHSRILLASSLRSVTSESSVEDVTPCVFSVTNDPPMFMGKSITAKTIKSNNSDKQKKERAKNKSPK